MLINDRIRHNLLAYYALAPVKIKMAVNAI